MSQKIKNVENARGPARNSEASYLFMLLAQKPMHYTEAAACLKDLQKQPSIEMHNKHSVQAHVKYWGKRKLLQVSADGVIALTDRAKQLMGAGAIVAVGLTPITLSDAQTA